MPTFNPPPNWPTPPAGWTPAVDWQPDPSWGPAPDGWDLWRDDRNWLSRHKGLAIAIILLMFFVVIPVGVDVAHTLSGDTAGVEKSIGARHRVSEHDAEIVSDIGRYPRQWNKAAAPFVADYQDPNITAEDRVAESKPHVEAMRAAAQGLEAEVLKISDPGIRGFFQPMVANYREKFAAVLALWQATASGDEAAEAQAATDLSTAANEGKELASKMFDDLRKYVSPEDFDRMTDSRR